MDLPAQLVRCGGNDREAADPLARRRSPVLPQAGQRHQPSVSQRDSIWLLPDRDILPLIEGIDRNEAAPPLERFPERWLTLDALSLGIDVGEPDLMSLAQKGTSPHGIMSKLRSPAMGS